MRLEVNGYVAAEHADANSIKYLIGDLHSETETSILLHDVEGVYLQANGVPKRGFSLYYINHLTGVEYASNNKRLKPRAVMRVLKHYLAGNALWRADIAWIPVTEQAIAEQKTRARDRSRPVVLAFLALVVGYAPLLFLIRFLLDELVFKPLCARAGFVVVNFTHGSGGSNFGVYDAPTCGYSNGSSVELPALIGNSAYLVDALGSMLALALPFLILLALLYAVLRYRQYTDVRTSTPPDESRGADTATSTRP